MQSLEPLRMGQTSCWCSLAFNISIYEAEYPNLAHYPQYSLTPLAPLLTPPHHQHKRTHPSCSLHPGNEALKAKLLGHSSDPGSPPLHSRAADPCRLGK